MITDDELRSVGFTGDAKRFPRNEMALVMFAAFNGITPDKPPSGLVYFPNEATQAAWNRVAETAAHYLLPEVTNARLIAAAPDLLEALKDAEEMLDAFIRESNPVRVKARAAISKAEGR